MEPSNLSRTLRVLSVSEQGDDTASAFSGAWLTPPPPSSQLKELQPMGVSPTPGLCNLGNTCFLNSALQCLMHLSQFVSLLLWSPHCNASATDSGYDWHVQQPSYHQDYSTTSTSDRRDRNGTKNKKQAAERSHCFCAFCALQALARSMHVSHPPRTLSPWALAKDVAHVSPSFRLGRQQDSHEYLCALFDGMVRAELAGCKSSSALISPSSLRFPFHAEAGSNTHRIFGGALRSSVVCMQCKHTSTTAEPFLDLSLEIANADSVEEALATFTAVESLSGENRYRCDGCKSLVPANKRISIRRAPNVLTLHVKRFDGTHKDGRHVAFGQTLDLDNFMHGKPKSEAPARYQLTGVIVHKGSSTSSGHYVACVKLHNGTWLLKDDSISTAVSLSYVLRQSAYMLFYTRVDIEEGRRSSTLSFEEVSSVHSGTALSESSCSGDGKGNPAACSEQSEEVKREKRQWPLRRMRKRVGRMIRACFGLRRKKREGEEVH